MSTQLGRGWLSFTIAAVLATASPLFAAETQSVQNDEYGIHVTFPVGSIVCLALSGSHPHGFYTRMYGKSCAAGDDPRASAISIYADYNMLDYRSGQAMLSDICPVATRNALVGAAQLSRLAFQGHATAQCLQSLPDGSLEIDVVTLGGGWTEGNLHPNKQFKAISYTVALSTTQEHLSADLALLRDFVASAGTGASEITLKPLLTMLALPCGKQGRNGHGL